MFFACRQKRDGHFFSLAIGKGIIERFQLPRRSALPPVYTLTASSCSPFLAHPFLSTCHQGSIFDPQIVWNKEKPEFEAQQQKLKAEAEGKPAALDEKMGALDIAGKKGKKDKSKSKGGKSNKGGGKKSAEDIKAENLKRQELNEHKVDIERMKNNNSIESLLKADVKTVTGKLQRVLKMLDIAVNALKNGKDNSSEEVRRSAQGACNCYFCYFCCIHYLFIIFFF